LQLAVRILTEIGKLNIPVNLVTIINNSTKESLDDCENTLNTYKISHRIVSPNEWKENIKNGCYGEAFKNYSQINSIPLGRTILHHHLYNETNNKARNDETLSSQHDSTELHKKV
jgi:hypothetical protein